MITTSANSENVQLTRQIFAWFESWDMDSLFAVLHQDVQARPSIDGAPVLEGRETVIEWWRSLAGSDNLEVRPLEFVERGDCVVVRGYLRHREGRTLAENQVFWVYAFRDGQIVRMESHSTRESAYAAC